jgi:surface protein
MFYYCSQLKNINTTNWNVSNVTTMYKMFSGCYVLNPNVSNWNVSKVTTMEYMFQNTFFANPDVSLWNTSMVTLLSSMFSGSVAANPNVTNWNVSNVTNMQLMFYKAKNANPDISGWNLSSLTGNFSAVKMFDGSGISHTNYDKALICFSSFLPGVGAQEWGTDFPISAHYSAAPSAAATARAALITAGWTIIDAGPI